MYKLVVKWCRLVFVGGSIMVISILLFRYLLCFFLLFLIGINLKLKDKIDYINFNDESY